MHSSQTVSQGPAAPGGRNHHSNECAGCHYCLCLAEVSDHHSALDRCAPDATLPTQSRVCSTLCTCYSSRRTFMVLPCLPYCPHVPLVYCGICCAACDSPRRGTKGPAGRMCWSGVLAVSADQIGSYLVSHVHLGCCKGEKLMIDRGCQP